MTARKLSSLSLLSLLTGLFAAVASVGCGQDSASSDARAPASNAAPDPKGASQAPDRQASPERAIAEADVVQLAGGRLYALSKSGTLSIVDVSIPSRLVLLGQAWLPGEPFEMYVRGDLLVVMTNGAYAATGAPYEQASSPTSPVDVASGAGVIVIDVKDPGLMQRVATFPVPGEIADSRVVGDVLYLATYENAHCFRCGAAPRTMVTTFDIATPTSMRQVDQVVFDAGATSASWGPTEWKRSIFVTPERMYVGGHADLAPSLEGGPSEGVIDVLDITDPSGKLVKGAHLTTTGTIRSRWQMDEHDGVLRVVSQRGTGWALNGIGDPEVQTFHIWNSGAMQEMGRTNIRMPRQEALKAVRFDKDRAYAITFAETDPLFVLDLADPAHPRQRGEIHMPGWVYHLEPHGDRLLGLGLDRRAMDGHLNVSLFDVSDMDHPFMIQRVSFGARGWTSDQNILGDEMAEDQDRIQKAFRVLDDGLIVVPYSGAGARASAYSAGLASDCASLGGGVQLIDWKGDTLVKQASLPVAGNPRRALMNQNELIAVSDSNVTTFDLGRRDVALRTADLVIGNCEVRPNVAQPMLGAEMDEEPRYYGGLFFCSSSSGASGKCGYWAVALLGLAAVGGALRRRRGE